jgi:hypothetical protein
MLTAGFITTPWPTLAPKILSSITFNLLMGLSGLIKKTMLTKYHSSRFKGPAPVEKPAVV